MKKALGIFAVLVFSIGLFSCEADTNIEETDALFKVEESACDGCSGDSGERGGGNG